MKPLFNIALFTVIFLIISPFFSAQDVCMVTADFQTCEHYMVIYNKPADIAGIDSVIIYRRQGQETVFSRIGSQSINELSYYVDYSSNTMDTTKYAIKLKDQTGGLSPLSFYHQGVVLDYSPLSFTEGTLAWTKYRKEDQTSESYQDFNCMMDQTGLGAFVSMGYFMWYQNTWIDPNYIGHPNAQYYIETTLSSCDITKANINTSRSNIKKQYPNSEAGLSQNGSIITLQISPNPVVSVLNVLIDAKLIGSKLNIVNSAGKIMYSTSVQSTDMFIDINEMAKGSYFLTVETTSKVFSQVFMKN
jgi:hypothetical protein